MSLVTVIYFIEILRGLEVLHHILGWSLAIILSAYSVFFIVIKTNPDAKESKDTLLTLRKPIKLLSIAFLLMFLVPSKDAGYKMLAAYGVETIATSDTVQRLAPKSLELLEKTIDIQLKKMNN